MKMGNRTLDHGLSLPIVRRRSLLAGGVAIASLVSGGSSLASNPSSARLWPEGFDPAWCFPHPSEAERLGKAILSQTAPETLGAIPPRPGWSRWLYPKSERLTVLQGLSDEIRADFAESRTIRVDGWLLALTEARLCASLAL
jgi:hypothetical protein